MVSQPPGWGKTASGANEMATAELVLNRLDELAQYFPHGLEYKVAYETTSFVKASIEDVVKTLLEAIALVFLVMYLFLQNFRATLIPTIAVPVVLMGTFSVLTPSVTASTPNHVRDGAGDRSAGG